MIDPKTIIYPKSRIKPNIKILYDGTIKGNLGFSIAELETTDNPSKKIIGIRYDYSDWSKNPDSGYPLIRGKYPCWFILPNELLLGVDLLNILSRLSPK